MKLQRVLEWLYRNEISLEIKSFWDAGWSYRFGDPQNGYNRGGCSWYSLDDMADAIERDAYELATPPPPMDR